MKHTDFTPFSHDRLSMLPRDKASTAALRSLDAVQNETPEEIVAATAILFAALVERLRLSPIDTYLYGRRILYAHQKFHKETNDALQSLRDFAGLRVAGDEVVVS